MPNQVRARILIEGRLQAMNFRYNTQQQAKKLGLTGFVRSLSDGRIEIEAQGEQAGVEKILAWCQEEPQNQGAWDQVKHRFHALHNGKRELIYAGRPSAAAPATGYHLVHQEEQEKLVDDALTGRRDPSMNRRG